MKRIFYFMLCAIAALAFASCEKPEGPNGDNNDPGNDNPGTEATEGLFVYGGATTAGFDLTAMESFDEVGGLYSWEGYLTGGAPFQFPTQSDSEWPAYMLSEDEEGNIVLVYGETEDDLVVYTVDIDGTYEVIIDMRDENNIIAEIALVAPDMSKMEITEVYILGDATATGWNLMAMGQFESDGNGIWTWEGPLKAMGVDNAGNPVAARFRFPLQQVPNTWWPCLMAGEDGELIFGNRDADEVNTPVEKDGMYRIVLDITDKENMTYTITLLEEGLPDPEVTELYLLGPAANGWDLGTAPAFEYNDGILTWEGDLKGNQDFRMTLSNLTDMWFPSVTLVAGTQNAVVCESQEAWDGGGYEHFKVAENGTYRIVVDAKDYDNVTVTITLVGEGDFTPKPEVNENYFVKELYMMGPAFDGGYNIPAAGTAAAFSYNDGIWTWEGNLSAGMFRFQTQDYDFVPCLFLGATEGTLVYVDNYGDAGTATHLSVAEAGTYRIVVDGRDAENLTYTITKL